MQKKIEKKGGEMVKNVLVLLLAVLAASGAGCSFAEGSNAVKGPTVLEFKLSDGKLVPGKVKANAYFEVEKDSRIYVFISPEAKEEFEKTGKTGNVIGIGFGPNGETVIFESIFAQNEYEKRHEAK